VPAHVPTAVHKKAQQLAQKTMTHLKGAGVFGIEMFVTKKGDVLINEIAPRVHNSGHYTIEACQTSQFEQHIRAITGFPLGSTDLVVPSSVMVNILGNRNGAVALKGVAKALAIPGVTVHIYGKAETKKQRKMGHITVVGGKAKDIYKKAQQARRYIQI
jgi:phosphoribosylaminoimidazole carboxylase PurK protein